MFEVLSLWQMQPCMQEICCNAAWIRTPFQYLLLSAPPEKETLSNSARDPHIWMHPPNAVSWLLDTRDPVAHCGRNNVFKSSRSSLALHLPSMARGLRGFWSDSVRGRSQLTGRQLSRELALDSAEWFEAAWSELVEQLIGIWKKCEEVIQFASIYNTNFKLLGWVGRRSNHRPQPGTPPIRSWWLRELPMVLVFTWLQNLGDGCWSRGQHCGNNSMGRTDTFKDGLLKNERFEEWKTIVIVDWCWIIEQLWMRVGAAF